MLTYIEFMVYGSCQIFFLKHHNNFTRFIAVLFPKCFALLYVLIILRLLPTHQWFVVHMEIEVVKIYNNAGRDECLDTHIWD